MWNILMRGGRKWTDWIGDRDLELQLRGQLKAKGYCGDSSRFSNIRLVAIQRPGWVQVFSFTATAKALSSEQQHNVVPETLLGLVRQDERRDKTDVEIFRDAGQRRRLFQEWSADLVTLRGERL